MKTQALKGMRDLLPNEQTLRDYIQGKILETYRASGFERISTPMLEDMDHTNASLVVGALCFKSQIWIVYIIRLIL